MNSKVGAFGTTLSQNQFDALVCFTYNVGTGNLANVLNGSKDKDGKFDLTKLPDRMKLYNKSSGTILPGLTRRRNSEVELFNTK